MSHPSKDLLFYSNHCEYSKSILIQLLKRGCRDNFYIVCVDNPGISIPRAVDRVPAIITRMKTLIMDDDVIKYIETFCGRQESSPQQPQQAQDSQQHYQESTAQGDVLPFSLASDINSYSDKFTFIEENPMDNRLMKFGYLGAENNTPPISTRDLSSQKSEKKTKMDEIYEKYIADRDAEIHKLFGNGPRPVV